MPASPVIRGGKPVARSVRRATPRGEGLRLPDPLGFATCSLLLVSIGRIHEHFSFLAVLRPGLLLVAVGMAYIVLNPHLIGRSAALRAWPAKMVAALFLWACITVPFALSPGGSFYHIRTNYWKVILFWLMLTVSMYAVRDIRRVIWAFLAAVGMLSYFSLFVFEMGQSEHVVRLTGDDMYMYDANDIAVMLNMGVPMALLVISTSARQGKIIGSVLLVMMMWTLAITGSRGGFMGFVLVAIFAFFLLNRISIARRLGSVVALVVLLTLAAPPGYWQQMKTITDTEENYNYTATNGRVQIWKRGMGYMIQRPLFGVGINNFGRAEGTISVLAREYRPGDQLMFAAPHNSFVQAGAELGVPGLLLFSGLICGGAFGLTRLRRRLPSTWRKGSREERFIYHATMYLPLAWIGFGSTSAFVSFAYMDPVYILAALTACIYAEALRRLPRTTRVPVRRGLNSRVRTSV